MDRTMWSLLFCFAFPALSIANNVNNIQTTRDTCVKQENVTNAATVAGACFKDLVQRQIQNNTKTSTCTNLNDLTTKIDTFYNVTLKTCYNETLQKRYIAAKPILMNMFELIFKENKLAVLSASNQFSCLKNNETRANVTKCIKFVHLQSNDTSDSYLWHRRATLHFDNIACSVRASNMKKCTNKALIKANCKEPLIEFINTMYDVILLNCEDGTAETTNKTVESTTTLNKTTERKEPITEVHTETTTNTPVINKTVESTTTLNKTEKGSSSRLATFSCLTLLFTGLIPSIADWFIV